MRKRLHLSNDGAGEEKDSCDTMGQKPAPTLWVHDIAACVGLLTRLPVKVQTELAMSRSAAATWAYPVVGFLVGGLVLSLFMVCNLLGIPAYVSLVLIVGFQIILTGAMHEDGLADSVDGLWGGWTVERRLAIMKDSHIGVYGVCAVSVFLMLKLSALGGAIYPFGKFTLAILGAAILSRAAMVALLYSLPPARGGGLGQSVGQPPVRSVWTGLALACGVTLVLGLIVGHPGAALAMIVVSGCAAWGCARVARAKIKGFTGDILGATQQVCEVAAIITASAFVY